MQPDLFNSTKGTLIMWSKILGAKLDSKLDAIVAEELHKPTNLDISKELELARAEALQNIVKKQVANSLSKHFNPKVHEQTEKAIQAFNSAMQKVLPKIENRDDIEKTRDSIFNRVLKEYPKANTQYSSHYGYSFVMPELRVTDIVNRLTDKVIAEIAETD